MSYLRRRQQQSIPTRRITIVSGNNQAATVNAALAAPLVVKVTDVTGSPVQGATVAWAASAGTVSVATSTTDSTGQTSVTYTNPAGAGTPTVRATVLSVAGVVATFSVTTNAPATPTMTINGGNGQSAAVSTAVATAPSVLLLNNLGQPAVGVTVTWAPSGSGTVGSTSSSTNASGIATCGSWTLSASPGANTLTATASGYSGSPVTFSATGTGTPTITANAGQGQSGVISTTLPIAPSVLVVDGSGNPAVGVSVAFAVTGGGGSVTGATQTTNASGIATVTAWTLGASAGTNTMTATAVGYTGSPVTFTATATTSSATGPGPNAPTGLTTMFEYNFDGTNPNTNGNIPATTGFIEGYGQTYGFLTRQTGSTPTGDNVFWEQRDANGQVTEPRWRMSILSQNNSSGITAQTGNWYWRLRFRFSSGWNLGTYSVVKWLFPRLFGSNQSNNFIGFRPRSGNVDLCYFSQSAQDAAWYSNGDYGGGASAQNPLNGFTGLLADGTTWHDLEVICTPNTAGSANGVLQFFLGGTKIWQVSGIQFESAGTDLRLNNVFIDWIWSVGSGGIIGGLSQPDLFDVDYFWMGVK